MELEKGDVVVVTGKLKKVVDFVASLDKEDLRILSSFFAGDAKGPTDARRLKKPLLVTEVYTKEFTVEVELTKKDVWEEKEEYFHKLTPEELEKENSVEEKE